MFAMLPPASSGVGGSRGRGGTNLDVACEFPEVIGLIPLAVFAMLPRASSGMGGSRGGGQCLPCCPGLALGWGVLGEGRGAVFAMLPRANSGMGGSRGGGQCLPCCPRLALGWGF